jgi:hypothetical protein
VTKKRLTIFFPFECFLCIFGTGLIFRSLEELISSDNVSEGSIVLGVLNEGSAETGIKL